MKSIHDFVFNIWGWIDSIPAKVFETLLFLSFMGMIISIFWAEFFHDCVAASETVEKLSGSQSIITIIVGVLFVAVVFILYKNLRGLYKEEKEYAE